MYRPLRLKSPSVSKPQYSVCFSTVIVPGNKIFQEKQFLNCFGLSDLPCLLGEILRKVTFVVVDSDSQLSS